MQSSTAPLSTELPPHHVRFPLLTRYARPLQLALVLGVLVVVTLSIAAPAVPFEVLPLAAIMLVNVGYLVLEGMRGCPSCRAGTLRGVGDTLACDECAWRDGDPLRPHEGGGRLWLVGAPLALAFATGALAARLQSTPGRSVAMADWPAAPLLGVAMALMGFGLVQWGLRWDDMPRWTRALCRPPVAGTPLFLGGIATLVGVGLVIAAIVARFG
jgi:hypothetical protein